MIELRLLGGPFDGYSRKPINPPTPWPQAVWVQRARSCPSPRCDGVHIWLDDQQGGLYYRFVGADDKGAAYEFGHLVEPDSFLANEREKELVNA